MPPIHIGDRAFQIILTAVVATILVFAIMTFFNAASMPTDENLFMDSPSLLAFGRALPAVPIEWRAFQAKGAFTAPLKGDDSIRVNDRLLSIGNTQVRTMETYRRVVASLAADTVALTVLRADEFRVMRWVVRLVDLTREPLIEQEPSVLVTEVTPGGASDRAGMRLGDFIVRINGAGFKTAKEADRVMRQGTSGMSNVYEVVRGGKLLTLNVVLAQFGISLGMITFLLAGIVYIAVGVFLGLKRPRFFSARMLSLWMVSIGYFLAVVSIRREPDNSLFVVIRNILMLYGCFLGLVFVFHADLVFPWQRPMSLLKRRVLALMYVLALISPAGILWNGDYAFFAILAVLLVMGVVVSPPFGGSPTPQQRALGRPIKIMSFVAVAGAFVTVVVMGLLGVGGIQGLVGLFLVFLPLTYLYTIGHYRLLDLDMQVRRNVQYSLLSWLWTGLVVMCMIWAFLALPTLPLLMPNVVVNGLAIEVRRELPTPEEQVIAQRAAAMILGVGVWFALWKLRAVGQRLLDRKYYRTRFDYGRASNTIAEVLSTRLSMNDIAHGLVDSLVELLKIRGAALVVFRNGKECCCDAVAGVPAEQWKNFAGGLDAGFTDALRGNATAVRVDHLPGSLADQLDRMNIDYVIPVRSKGTLSGAILVGQKLSDTLYSSEDLSFLAGVAQQVSVSIENAFLYEGLAEQDRMRHELAIARQIQLDSLPSVTPQVAGLDVAGSSSPALEVGGDFFDYLDGNGSDLMVIVGDVSGKGTSAALYMSKVQGILRSLHLFGLAPQELFMRANRLLCADLQKNSFITASAALFLPKKRLVKLVRAGHLPVYLFRASTGAVERVVPRGLGLGLSDAEVFANELEERTQTYGPGDVLVLVTDGVTEARNPAGDEYGEERLARTIAEASTRSAREIRDQLTADLTSFGGGEDPHDDQTIVVVRVS
jgi:serine phosphatase RsbU (regulator of sigma subunit)